MSRVRIPMVPQMICPICNTGLQKISNYITDFHCPNKLAGHYCYLYSENTYHIRYNGIELISSFNSKNVLICEVYISDIINNIIENVNFDQACILFKKYLKLKAFI